MHSVPKLKIYHQEDVPDGVFEWGSSRNELYFSDAGFEDEESFDIRGEILGEIDKILAGVTDASSKKILKRWKKLSQ